MLLSDLVGRLKFFFDAIPEPDGLTVSGGEPFDQPDALIKILRSVKDMGVDDILIYSGYRVETLLDRHPELPELAGALVDGPFENGNDTECVWKGSDNQSLTLWRGELSARYEEWTSGATRKLQWVKNGCQSLLVGIPRQGDVGRLRNPYG
jgi:anaerobic ribonucleoside-triphosphate reductase activating protein